MPVPLPFVKPARSADGMWPRRALTPLACAMGMVLHGVSAWAQDADAPPIQLKPSGLLQEQWPEPVRTQLPTFLSGERITGRTDLETVIDGDAELRRGTTVIRADHVEYLQPDDLARARGNVQINSAGNTYSGTALDLKVDAFEGFFTQPSYRLLKNSAYGQASRIDFLDDKRAIIHNADYTTCQREPGIGWLPDWILRADTIRIDNDEEVGVAEGAVLRFKDVPILPLPTMSFPLSDRRKSGLLPPIVGLDTVSGAQVTLPYYWNIAPNRDATFTPTLMARRGVDLGGEFRYLEKDYTGQVQAQYMPGDTLRDRDRWGLATVHNGTINSAAGLLGLNLTLNRVSDANYWRDFPRATSSLTQRLLANDGNLSWGQGDFSAGLRVVRWQTLQDVTAPITPPYDRLPQLVGRYNRASVGGFDVAALADYTQFDADRRLTLQPNGKRAYTQVQLSRPWLLPGVFITPKVQINATRYDFDRPLANGRSSANRTLPTFSLDSGLIFERDANLFGRALRQTLEPRAFYVYTPFRNQSLLPNYDSAVNDFNFATVYTENAFGGNDRISDSNLLTLGATTRLLDPATGAEAARFGVAQRLRFQNQDVTLPGAAPVSDRVSDVLVGASVNWDPRWVVDSTVQYNPKLGRSIRSTVGGRYNPGSYRVVSAAYRFARDSSEQIDVGWQWPLRAPWSDAGAGPGKNRWYSVGRLNYSLRDAKLVDSIVGLEYDGCCWIGRIVIERLQSSTTTATQRLLFQLEFVGFTRVGASPLRTLQQNIPGYRQLREQTVTPSRFSAFD